MVTYSKRALRCQKLLPSRQEQARSSAFLSLIQSATWNDGRLTIVCDRQSHALGGHFLSDDIGLFDAGFFNLSADAASAMDPQLRILLESVHEAFENGKLVSTC